jgi:hypothetical protein
MVMTISQHDGWRPTPGQIALIEPMDTSDVLTGVVVPASRLTVDLGASPRPKSPTSDVIASFFAADALYKLTGKATVESDGLVTIDVASVERVQRRATPRALVSLPVKLTVPTGTTLSGETIDVSAGGCRVTTADPWSTEADPEVWIDMPDGEALVTSARVVTSDLTGNGWEYRLSVPGIAPGDRDRLTRLVALGV